MNKFSWNVRDKCRIPARMQGRQECDWILLCVFTNKKKTLALVLSDALKCVMVTCLRFYHH